jgi:hypothetical protein
MHQEETPTSQLGWHPGKPPSYAAKLKFLLKKREKCIQRGGTRARPSETNKKAKKQKNTQTTKICSLEDHIYHEKSQSLSQVVAWSAIPLRGWNDPCLLTCQHKHYLEHSRKIKSLCRR